MMPRWLVWITYLMGLGLIIGAGAYRTLRLGFPICVLVASILILRKSLRDGEDSICRTNKC